MKAAHKIFTISIWAGFSYLGNSNKSNLDAAKLIFYEEQCRIGQVEGQR